VADDASNHAGPFSVPTIKALIRLMARHNVSEIDLREGDQRIRLIRGGRPAPAAVAPEPAPQPAAAPPALAARPETAPAGPARSFHEIKSELVGTFYSAREPGAEPFVRIGSRVKAGDVLCLIEAMKLFNEVQVDRAGVIAEVCVENQQPVEYGQVLFRLDPTG
jgi:acetyl-CoA carboxylase biotin carboxyl carrier protein